MNNYNENNENNGYGGYYNGPTYDQNYNNYNNNYGEPYNSNQQPKRPRKRNKLAIALVCVLLLGAIGVTGHSYIDKWLSNKPVEKASNEKIENTKLDIKQVSKKDDTPNYVSKIVEGVMPSIVTIAS